MKKVIILGSTGSIGKSAIDVIKSMPGDFKISALSAHSNEEELLKQAALFNVKQLALAGKKPADKSIAYYSPAGLLDMISETDADIVVNGVAGSDGLLPSIASLKSGKNLALANKETIVMAGSFITDIALQTGKKIIPVDSEHSAVFQLLEGKKKEDIDEIILTASGGAFRNLSSEELKNAKLEDALKHPNWSMGTKITIDSASMANKGLEVIEAYLLFNLPLSRIKVLIHPQSMVHSLVRMAEGSLYAQISEPDMRVPIQNALTWPKVGPLLFGKLDLTGLSLTFQAPDFEKYKMLKLAYSAAELGQGKCIIYNAANEVAVDAFMNRKIDFLGIPHITEHAIENVNLKRIDTLEDIIEADNNTRIFVKEFLGEYIKKNGIWNIY
ncbi:MAG: 1-deoxy-D-xylulose-5-phosphate reductoisomerase [Spirochaetes bacterium]|nr:1-deoxy-D-xylulose-5-phosphate reductoisomerase [Spirochaetota bacterium]